MEGAQWLQEMTALYHKYSGDLAKNVGWVCTKALLVVLRVHWHCSDDRV